MGLAVMMAVQTPAMAAEVETLPEASAQETVQETVQEETELQTEETKQQIEETQPQTLVPTEVTEFEMQSQTEEQIETTELAEIETVAQTESEAQNTPTQEEIITESATETEAELESEATALIEESEELEVLSEVQTYAMPTEEQNKELADKVEEIIQYLNLDGKADYDKIFAIYNYVCQNVEYDWAATDVDPSNWDGGLGYGQLAYEALCEGKAVCAGIARAVNLLLDRAEISNYYVSGTEWGVAHAWNLVELNGEYYFVDATSDLNQDAYKYFLKCEADFSEHVYTSIEGLDDVSSIKWAEKSYCDTVEGGYEKVGDFLINGGKGDITIHSYIGHEENVVIPAEINGRKVKSIAQYAIQYSPEMKTLTISEGVEKIASLFVNWAPNLVKVSLPTSAGLYSASSGSFHTGISGFIQQCESLEVIEVPKENPYLAVVDGALYDKSLTTLITYPAGSKTECVKIPEGVTTISSDAFECNQYLKKVVFPDSVVEIDYWAFNGCSALEEINIPKNCKLIGQFAFCGTSIKHIKIPATVVDAIFGESFMGSPVETIEVEEGNPYYRVENGALYAENNLIMYEVGSRRSEFVVPEGTEFIWDGAFYGASNLKKVTIASTVKRIEQDCFYGCSQLEEVSIKGDVLEEIGVHAFMNCSKLKTINIPETVSVIREYAFCQCDSLTEITLPKGLKEISESLFYYCKQLTTVGIPASVTTIKADAFRLTTVKNIYYTGNEKEWEQINKGNNDFASSKIFFNGEVCNHIWSDEFAVDIEPTCEETGQKSIHCTVCGLMKKDSEQEIPAKGHEFVERIDIEPTCEETGQKSIYCTVCGLVKKDSEQEIPARGHEFSEISGIMADEKIEFWHCSRCNKNFADEQGTEQVTLADGWIEMSDGMHYLQSGVFLIDSWLTLDGYTYYLGDDGVRLSWIIWTSFDQDNRLIQYQFDNEGHLMVNCWKDEYYYGEDGRAYIGMHEIEGAIYYFSDYGIMQSDVEVVENGIYYYFGADGKLTWKDEKACNHIWSDEFTIDKEPTCVEDGQKSIRCTVCGLKKEGSEQEIPRKSHRFSERVDKKPTCDENGRKYIYCTVCEYKEEVLIPSLGHDLVHRSGTIANENIEFWHCIRCNKNFADEQGTKQITLTDGWRQDDDGNTTYIKGGELVQNQVLEIDGNYYGFDENGILYVNQSFNMYKSDNGVDYVMACYRAKEDGSLYVNEWYTNQLGNHYYYGQKGEGYSGLHEVDGKNYYFSWGKVCTNQCVSENGKSYYCDPEGYVSDISGDGWHQVGDYYFYIKKGQHLSNTVEKTGNSYYGFDYRGVMYANRDFSIWNFESQMSSYYRAKEDGRLYANEWYTDEWEVFYYYGEDGKAYSGLHEIDGKQYCFSEYCRRYQDQSVTIDGKSYYCKSDGSAIELQNNDWTKIDDQNLYVKDGQVLINCVEKIGDSYYGFDEKGFLIVNRSFGIWNEKNERSDEYRAKEDGHLYRNEWYVEEDRTYYYGEDGKAYSGLQEVDGIRYYFYPSGWRYQNEIVTADGKVYYCKPDGSAIELQNNDWTKVDDHFMYVKDGQALINCVEKIGDSYYGFNYIGVMYANEDIILRNFEGQISSYYRAKEDGRLYVNEWYVDERVYYFYYGDEGRAASGLTQVDGTLYYFSENGCRYQNEKITVDGRNYYCKSDGEVIELQENGWIKDGENDKYVKDGQVLTDCVEKIGDSYYSFDSTGVMYRNTVLTRWDEAAQKYTYYFIKADGRLYVNEWYEYDKYDNHGHGIWYYYGDEGKAASGLTQINGTLYYFSEDGRLYQDQTITVDGKIYYCNLDGIAVELQNNRWTKVDGKYRYVKDGQALTNCVEKIGDFYYGFDSDGYMFADEQFNLLDSESGNTCYYRAHEDGHLYRNEWYMNYKGLWYYFGNDAKMYFGLREVNGILYYFGSRMYQDESVTVDGKNYYCKSSGEAVELSKNGWNLVDGNYLYVKDGQLLRECLEKIGDAYYYFGYSGVMLSDTTFGLPNTEGEYRVHADGSLYISQWYRINGYWEYYGETGLRKTGWLSLGNIWYYLNEYGWMVTGWQIVAGTWYFFDGSGAMVVGWVNLNGTWYYLSGSGAMVTGWLDLNGTWYYMGADGAMLTGTQVIGGTTYIFNQDGAWVAN